MDNDNKDPRQAFNEEYKALVEKYHLALQAFPIVMIGENGILEYRAFEYRIVEVKRMEG